MTWLDRQIERFIVRIRDNPDIKRIPIGPNPEDPTYWRWFVIPRNRFLNIYLHNFRHDDEEYLHDHRMLNVSFTLQGDYFEERFVRKPVIGEPLPATKMVFLPNHRIKIRLPSTPHRVVLATGSRGNQKHMWSLFIGFPHWRDWTFWCGNGHSIHCDTMVEPGRNCDCSRGMARVVPWQRYVQPSSVHPSQPSDPTSIGYGQRGKGCDE